VVARRSRDAAEEEETRLRRAAGDPAAAPGELVASRERRSVEHLPIADTAQERMEWEVLGLNVHRHPLSPYRAALGKLGVVSSKGIRDLPHGTRVRAAGLIECLQSPPTRSSHRVYFLLIEDEWGLLQATIFRSVYERCGDILHREGAFLLDGRVEQTAAKGFAFLVRGIGSLQKVVAGAGMRCLGWRLLRELSCAPGGAVGGGVELPRAKHVL
jgi:DNA polymerase III alpha subunit